MFEVGFTELLLIAVLGLIVLGPEKLPRVAAQLGRWIGRARAMARQFKDQLEDEINIAEAQKPKPGPSPESTAASGAADAGAEGTGSNEPVPPVYTGETSPPPTEPTPAAGQSPEGGAAETAHAENPNAPAPEPEASVYEPPVYATTPSHEPATAEAGAQPPSAVESPSAHEDGERPRRQGDFITTTHERGI